MITLGIDTSNYATSVALVDNDTHQVIFSEKRFLSVDEGKIGLRQQQALFEHIKNLTNIFSSFKGVDIGAVGVSVRPKDEDNSYMPCFLAGKMSAYSIGGAMNLPVIESSHQTGHLASALFDLNKPELFDRTLLMLHVSGGTTDILLAENGIVKKSLGSSMDLFAGQAVDRLGVKLGFPFPAGQYVSDLAEKCEEKIPKPKISVKGYNCNLSGLENQCDKLLAQGYTREYVCKYCLTFVAHTLIKMIKNVKEDLGDIPLVLAGGVMSSTVIKKIVTEKLPDAMFVKPQFSSDNAIGVAVNAYRKVTNG
ncbi:MAG: glycoprotease [Oscillospiraceae bacterium]|nr:glycoprotease [Oscillospiraceae bacterium]